jgi:hypothetical protein
MSVITGMYTLTFLIYLFKFLSPNKSFLVHLIAAILFHKDQKNDKKKTKDW